MVGIDSARTLPWMADRSKIGSPEALSSRSKRSFAVMALSSVISYMRAKAESLGLDAKGGLMERAERIIALCLGLLFPVLLIPILWITLALTAITAVQRFMKVWKQAAVAPVTAAKIEMRRSRRQTRRVVRTERRHTRIARPGRTTRND